MSLNMWPENSFKIMGKQHSNYLSAQKKLIHFSSLAWNFIISPNVTVKLRHQVQRREANGKRGVGAAHMASSQVGDESAIGPNSSQGKSGRKPKSNFPPKKKPKNDSGDLGGFAG